MQIEHQDEWQFQHAKAHLSQVVRDAEKSPQTITVHGEPKVIVLSIAEYNRRFAQTCEKESGISLLDIMQEAGRNGLIIDTDRVYPPDHDEDLFE